MECIKWAIFVSDRTRFSVHSKMFAINQHNTDYSLGIISHTGAKL